MHIRFQQILYWSTIGYDVLLNGLSKSFYVLGYTKSGTNWVCNLLSDYLEIPVHEPWKDKFPALSPRIFHMHRILPFRSAHKRTLYLIRDGRDTMVSRYFALVKRKEEAAQKKQVEATIGNELRYDNIRENLPAFIRYMAKDTTSSVDYKSHIEAWLENGYVSLKYEDMLADPEGEFARVLEEMTGKPADKKRVAEVVQRNSFEAKSKRKAGEEDQTKFMRKGISGDWKNYFSREAAEVFDQYAGNLLIQIGYEQDHRWVEECE
jgi:hypothetical protein